MKHISKFLPKFMSLAVIGLLLSACGGGSVGSIIGMDERQARPDEFSVVRRAPLTLPPNFELRPPNPRGVREQNLATRSAAEQVVFGNQAADRARAAQAQAKDAGVGGAEMALLNQTGAFEADPDIRTLIEEEGASLSSEDQNFIDNLLFWRNQNNVNSSNILDSQGEARRIQENAALGTDITQGDSPTIRRDNDAPLFNWF